MLKYISIIVPHEVVNDDYVTLVNWHISNNQKVIPDDLLFEFETSKTTIEVRAEEPGYISIIEKAGTEVKVGQEVARLYDAMVEISNGNSGKLKEEISNNEVILNQESEQCRISRKAQRLIDSEKLDSSLFSEFSIVRESDVRAVLLEMKKKSGDTNTSIIQKNETNDLALWDSKGRLEDAKSAAKERGWGVLRLAFNYFFRNYLLSLLVRVAPRGIILPLHRLRGVKIGKKCFVDPAAIIETAYPENIIIGNDVRIAAQAIIMTHIKAPQFLRESDMVPLTLKQVVLQDHSFIGVNSVIMPGVTIGEAAVVASGAVVTANVPAFTMVAGNPAKVIKRFRP
tara:strand:+ start:1582 stop:2604 length:1023 start_codon:yes stop_codon:yes gene_type:complete